MIRVLSEAEIIPRHTFLGALLMMKRQSPQPLIALESKLFYCNNDPSLIRGSVVITFHSVSIVLHSFYFHCLVGMCLISKVDRVCDTPIILPYLRPGLHNLVS